MTAKKQSKTSKEPTNKKLSALERKLYDCMERKQPVLLYGKDTHMRKRFLITMCMDLWGDREYRRIRDDIIIITRTNSLDDLGDLCEEMEMASDIVNRDDHKRVKEILRENYIVYRTVDFQLRDGKAVYEKFKKEASFSLHNWLHSELREYPEVQKLQEYQELYEYECYEIVQEDIYYRYKVPYLLGRRGVVFADNLHCKANDASDLEYFAKLALHIEEEIKTNRFVSAPWLVVYAYNPKTFPQYFLDQFELVSLDGEEAVVGAAKEVAESGADKQQEKKAEDEKDITPNPLFMDDKGKVLYLDKNNTISLALKQIGLIKYMRKEKAFYLLEDILTGFFGKEITETYKHKKELPDIYRENIAKPPLENKPIPKEVRNIFGVYKYNINNRCKPLGIGDLIVKHKKMKNAYKLSRTIKIKRL